MNFRVDTTRLSEIWLADEEAEIRAVLRQMAARHPESGWERLTEADLIRYAAPLARMAQERLYCRWCPGLDRCAADSRELACSPRHSVVQRIQIAWHEGDLCDLTFSYGPCREARAHRRQAADRSAGENANGGKRQRKPRDEEYQPGWHD